ncbi:MAG: hypothetical protein ABEJ72_04350, partial [Candidatus Aenigmatarchaeota archaeon]
LFYEAVSEEGGVDAVMEEAFDPRDYSELEEVFKTIEASSIDYDEEVYEFSKLYLDQEKGL